MTHHPQVHMIVPGGGISLDGTCWVRCKPGFLRGSAISPVILSSIWEKNVRFDGDQFDLWRSAAMVTSRLFTLLRPQWLVGKDRVGDLAGIETPLLQIRIGGG
jgi:hypothetical protein